ncbi:coiled-coil domain-containing protein 180-like [Saccoglossus kowalevskii]|uniref:Coiled-coil domain-containing protein 180-like n=1 Tax=Saccoglossus kowalevskii TaxID=10224 RepID=A0ABM0H1Y7_SACKO|nr:PREDICTED: coiled-coil domain-containing protein 180-like [Saccoglossus kowalevskii]
MMAEARIVPSGQIYRQIFDAEVQLVKEYEKLQEKRNDEVIEIKTQKVPLVKDGRKAMGESLLNERQRTWIESMPNDSVTENPTFYRQLTSINTKQLMEPESQLAAREVRGLADTVKSERTGSDIIERIEESRRNRHEAAVEDMHQELAIIASDLEPRITEAGEILIQNLASNDEEIAAILAKISDDQVLQNYSLAQLISLWDEVASHSSYRQTWIIELDQTLSRVESHREELIAKIFKHYAKMLEGIAHLMPPDVQRLLEKESQIINQTMLANRRAYADLFARLMKNDVERERNQHEMWRNRVEDWKQLNINEAVKKFTEFMQSEEIVQPSGIDNLLTMMKTEQNNLNTKRLELLNSLKDMNPPSSTKTAVYSWNSQLTAITRQIDELHVQYMGKLHEEYERVCQVLLDKVDNFRSRLVEDGICTDEKVIEVIEEHFLPQLGQRQRIFEDNLENMDKALEQLSHEQELKLKSLFKFAQGAAHVWDVHEIGLAKRERDLQEKLEACRHEHDNKNQDMEANLDIIMDRMRQEGSQHSLKETLEKSLATLDKIKAGYEKFHKDQVSLVKNYPYMVQQELKRYDEAVCKFYTVGRNNPDDKSSRGNSGASRRSTSPSARPTASDSPGRETPRSASTEAKRSPVPTAVREVLSTDKGTTFYVLTVAGQHGLPDFDGSVFLTEADVAELPPHIQNIQIMDELMFELRKIMRMNFLNHLEDWVIQAIERANSVVAAKCEELNSELELRLHLHGPRSRRAELDIHNVRAAEIVMHQERVSRHSKGIAAALNDLKTRFTSMQQNHNKLAEQFKEEIDSLETVFINATKSSTLVALQHTVTTKLDSYMGVIRASLRQFRKNLDDTLQMLRESNARFIKSFKAFSDGGNFSPEEIDDYKKKLEKLSHRIDSSEGFIMADLEGMEAKRLEQASHVASTFEDRFKNHLFDLTFMEKLARWLTNTQVKIKAEVADSNTQAQKLAQHLQLLERRIDACQKPNLDKEQITSQKLLDSLKEVIGSFHERCRYLNCMKYLTVPQGTEVMQGNIAVSSKVGFAEETSQQIQADQQQPIAATTTTTVVTIKTASKQPVEDAAVGIMKNILSSQRVKMRMGLEDHETDALHTGVSRLAGTQSTQSDDQKSKSSRPQTKQSDKDRSKAISRRSTGLSVDGNPRRTASANIRRTSKTTKFDKKYYVFGEKKDDEKHFLAIIRAILWDAMDGLLSTSEVYYRQKGNRAPTRPQAIQDIFDQCAESVVIKLQSYYNQSDEYHNHCLQEFRGQLEDLEELIAEIPPLVIRDLLREQTQTFNNVRVALDHTFKSQLHEWDKRRNEHKTLLRPTLGHPHNQPQLLELSTKEDERREEYLSGVESNTKRLQESSVELAKSFVDKMSSTTEQILLMLDSSLIVDDVETGRVDPKKHKTSTLIKRKQSGRPLEDEEYKPVIERAGRMWQGIPSNELIVGDKPEQPELTASVTSAKTTLAHASVVHARDEAYKEYLQIFNKNLQNIEDEKQEQLIAEERWSDSWRRSVEKVKNLY